MTLPIYMDENVHGAISSGLRQQGIDVLTVQEDNRSGISDPAVMARAVELNRILFSQDDDLLAEASKYQDAGEPFPGVVFARQNRVSIGICIQDLKLISTLGNPNEFKDRVIFLPL